MKRFKFIEHTADVAVRVYGRSLNDLFESAAHALTATMVEKFANRPVQGVTEKTMELEAKTQEDLLKAWLDEFVFEFSAHQFFLHRVKDCVVTEISKGYRLEAKVLLCLFDPLAFRVKQEVKAVTYHGLRVEKVRQAWQAFVLFDV